MFQFFKDNKTLVLGGVLALVGIYAYFTYFSPSGNSGVITSENVSPVSRDLLITLSSLHTIKLDEKIFTDPVFLSLNDFGVTLPLETVGRQNPFAPLLGSGSTKSSSKTGQ